MPFEFEPTELESGVMLLTLSGTMTMGNQLQRFEWSVEELTKKSRNRIVLDMSALTYLDSSAIGVLMGCNGVVRNSGGQMRLAGLTDRVRGIFKVVGIDSVLTLDPTREDAISSLAASA